MKKDWKLPSNTFPTADRRRIEHVLDEHDGPVAISLRDEEGHRFFAVAADRDGRLTRWIETEIGDAQWKSLLSGATALRDVFTKPVTPVIYVVDREPDLSVVSAWEVTPGVLVDSHLPVRGAVFEGGFADLLGE